MFRKWVKGPEFGLACAGAAAFVSQILLLREFLNVFGGNELVVGSFLANWLLLSGAGALLGQLAFSSKASARWIATLLLGASVALPLQLIAIRFLRSNVPAGLIPGVSDAAIWSAVVLCVPCVINGFLVPACARLLADAGSTAAPGRSYMFDTLGAALGGILGAFMVIWLGTFESAAAVVVISGIGAAALMLDHSGRRLIPLSIVGATCVLAAIPIMLDADNRTARWLFPGQDMIWQRHTPYGHLAATRYGSQLTVHQNALPAASTDDVARAEEIVHCVLGYRTQAADVLLLSGGLTGVLREAAKYPAKTITLVEQDPEVLRLVPDIDAAAKDERVRLVNADPRAYLENHAGAFDAIVSALPDPLTLGANRFFTVEFFRAARRALRDGGVLGLSIGASENVVTRLDLGALTSVGSGLRSVFQNVAAIPGARVHMAASDSSLDRRIDLALVAAGIQATYVNPAWFSDRLSHGRVEALAQTIRSTTTPNSDFFPAAFAAAASKWSLRSGGQWLLGIGSIVLVIMALALVWSGGDRPVSAAIGASGFAGMGLQIVILMAFQVSRGSLYLHITAILCAFLAGAAIGGLHGCLATGRPLSRLMATDCAFAFSALIAAPALGFIHAHLPESAPGWLAALPFACCNGWLGYLVGAQFQPAASTMLASTRTSIGAATARLYGLDLIGGALGAIIIALVLIPRLGLAAACYLIAALKLCTALVLVFRRRRSIAEVPCAGPPRWAFASMALALAVAGVLIVADETSGAMGAFAGSRLYHGLALALLVLTYLGAMGWAPLTRMTRFRAIAWLTQPKRFRWIQFVGLGLVAFYPIFRCFFKIPYLFCHVCPRQCAFGYFRPYIIPAALLMNLRSRHWCQRACPIGTLQHHQGSGRQLPRWVLILPLTLAAASGWAWFRVRADAQSAADGAGAWFQFFFKNGFTVSTGVLLAAAAILALGWIWHRLFCGGVCPVGGVSELLTRFERWFNGRERSRGSHEP